MKSISTIVGTVVFIIISILVLSTMLYMFHVFDKLVYHTIDQVRGRALTQSLSNCVSGWWLNTTSTLTINLTNRCVTSISIVGLLIVFSNTSLYYVDSNNGSLTNAYYTIVTASGIVISDTPLSLPLVFPAASTMNITFEGILSPYSKIALLSLAVSASPGIAVVPLKPYYEAVVPGNVTIVVPPAPNVTIEPLPWVLDGYVFADKLLLVKPGQDLIYYPVSINVSEGQLLAGGVEDLYYLDGDYIVVNSSYTIRCLTPDWPYYREVYIENPGTVTYTDVVVDINLTSADFSFNKTNSDGSDIRVLDENCNPLPFWIEYWDTVGGSGRIWVRVPQLPPEGLTLLIFYGNPTASTASNATAVFDFYEDLEVDYNNDGIIDDNDMIYAGWQIVSIANGLWHVAQPGECSSIDHTWYYGSEAAGCTYNVGVTRGYIVTPTVTLPSLESGAVVKLRFYTKWQHESYPSGDYDTMNVEVSTDNGATWTVLWHRDCNEGPSEADWHWEVIDLSAYAGSDVLLRFLFDSIDSLYNNYEGWYVDKIMVYKSLQAPPPINVSEEKANSIARVELSIGYPSTNGTLIFRGLALYFEGPSDYYYSVVLSVDGSIVYADSGVGGGAYSVNTTDYSIVVSGSVLLRVSINASIYFVLTMDQAVVYMASFNTVYGIGIASNVSVADRLLVYVPPTGEASEVPLPDSLLASTTNYTVFSEEPLVEGATRLYLWVARGSVALAYNLFNSSWMGAAIDLIEPVGPSAVLYANGTHLYYIPGVGSQRVYVYDISSGDLAVNLSLPVPMGSYAGYAAYGELLYIHTGSTGHLILVNTSSGIVSDLGETTTLYIVGMDAGDSKLWVLERGGGLQYYDLDTSVWNPRVLDTPYYPFNPGDRLIVLNGRLYHVRGDGSNELLVYRLG